MCTQPICMQSSSEIAQLLLARCPPGSGRIAVPRFPRTEGWVPPCPAPPHSYLPSGTSGCPHFAPFIDQVILPRALPVFSCKTESYIVFSFCASLWSAY